MSCTRPSILSPLARADLHIAAKRNRDSSRPCTIRASFDRSSLSWSSRTRGVDDIRPGLSQSWPASPEVLPKDLPCHSPSIIETPSRAGAALELRRLLGQPLDECDHFLHPLAHLRLGLLRTLGEGGLERVLQVRDGDPEHLEQTARAVLSHGSPRC